MASSKPVVRRIFVPFTDPSYRIVTGLPTNSVSGTPLVQSGGTLNRVSEASLVRRVSSVRKHQKLYYISDDFA
jgi:hypothetical protein